MNRFAVGMLVATALCASHACASTTIVSADSVWSTLQYLTGEVPTPLGDSLVTIATRYTPTVGYDRASRFLEARTTAWGYATTRDYFLPSTLMAISFGDTRAWLAGLQVAAGSQTLASSSDDGITWSPPAGAPSLSSMYAIAAGNGDTVTVAGVTANGDSGAVAWSADRGASWTTGVRIAGTAMLGVSRRARDVWACGEAGTLAHSADAGATWTVESAPTNAILYAIAASDDSTVFAGGAAGTLLRRRARDGMWSLLSLGWVDAVRAITFLDARHGWIVGANGFTARTVDGGNTWLKAGAGNAFLTAVAARDSLHVAAAGFAGAFRTSVDGGAHWTVGVSGVTGDINALAVSGARRDSLWLGGRQRLAVSLDDGHTWDVRNASIHSSWFNLIATRAGSVPSAGSVVACGHLDSHSETPWTRAPGADDNASGSALLLEAARVLAGPATPRTLQFVWFGGEEDGLLGSTPRAAAQRAAGDSLALLLDNDQVGRGSSMTVYGNSTSAADLDSAAAIAARDVPELPLITAVDPTYRGSDQAPYWDQGYRAISFVESAWKSNTDIESTRDSLGAVDVSLVTRLTRLVVAIAGEYLTLPSSAVRGHDATDEAARPRVRAVDDAPDGWRVRVDLPRLARVDAALYDITGRRLTSAPRATPVAGAQSLTIARLSPHSASGVYIWRVAITDVMTGETDTITGRIVRMR